MPISTINPDGSVKIYNSKTGETKDVPANELARYNPALVGDYQKRVAAQQGVDDTGNAVAKGVMTLDQVPQDQRASVSTNLIKKGITPLSKDQQAAADAKKNIQSTAQKVLDVLSQHDAGKLSDKAFDDALNFAASDYNQRGFSEGGKSLTGTERGLLSGGLITTQDYKGNAFDKAKGWLTGYAPPVKSKVSDDEQTIRNKMMQVLQGASPDLPPGSAPEGKAVQEARIRKASTIPPSGAPTTSSATPDEPQGKSISGSIGNGLNDVLDIGKGLWNIPGEIGDLAQHPDQIVPTLKNVAKGTVKDLADTAGVSMGADGKVKFNAGDALNHAYEHPVDTALTVLPFTKALKELSLVGKGGKVAKAAEIAGKVGEEGKIGGIAGRLATSVAVPDPENVSKSEQLMKTALNITKSNSTRGMAKELEDFVPKAGKLIENHAADLDKQIGPQPLGEITNSIGEKLAKTTAAQADPNLLKQVMTDVQHQLNAGDLPGGMANGEPYATNFSKMNEARKYLNSGLSSWFERGRPLQSAADLINGLKWEASSAIKDIMGEADNTDIFKKTLSLQHAAIETAPALAKKALASHEIKGFAQIPAKVANTVAAPFKTAAARKMAGGTKTTGLTDALKEGLVPTPANASNYANTKKAGQSLMSILGFAMPDSGPSESPAITAAKQRKAQGL